MIFNAVHVNEKSSMDLLAARVGQFSGRLFHPLSPSSPRSQVSRLLRDKNRCRIFRGWSRLHLNATCLKAVETSILASARMRAAGAKLNVPYSTADETRGNFAPSSTASSEGKEVARREAQIYPGKQVLRLVSDSIVASHTAHATIHVYQTTQTKLKTNRYPSACMRCNLVQIDSVDRADGISSKDQVHYIQTQGAKNLSLQAKTIIMEKLSHIHY